MQQDSEEQLSETNLQLTGCSWSCLEQNQAAQCVLGSASAGTGETSLPWVPQSSSKEGKSREVWTSQAQSKELRVQPHNEGPGQLP